ncbi:MAG: bifunctional riboflavin kinase/FAD synthetase [Gemmataceae bacterium]
MAHYPVDWRLELPPGCRGGALAIGNFDGAHRGHAELILRLTAAARQVGGPAVAVTFDPHPRAVLRPEAPLPLLSSSDDRAEQLHRLGANHVVTLGVTTELLDLRAAEFFDLMVLRRFQAKAMVEGTNFCFGKDREGDIALLEKLCGPAGVRLQVVPPLAVEGIEVSSSRIRQALEAGDVGLATKLLGRPYLLRGVVGVGQRRGRTIGFPTANLERVATVVPGEGVYAVRAEAPNGARHAGAANVGPNPTFGEEARKIEVHLIGFEGDLYGQPLAVEFLARLRDTRRFSGAAELVAQLKMDTVQARAIAG